MSKSLYLHCFRDIRNWHPSFVRDRRILRSPYRKKRHRLFHHHETQRQYEKSRRVEQNTFLTVALSHKFHLGFWCLCAYTHTRVYAQCYTSTILQEKQINVNTKSQFRKLSQILPFSLCIAAKKSTITCISTFFSLLCLKIRCFRCNIWKRSRVR